jgi:uncharacterized RDD family membrane protein YckC
MNSLNDQKTVGFFRLAASIFYDALLLTAVLFFATLPLISIPEDLQSILLVEAMKVFWYLLVSYIYFAGFWLKGGQTPGMKPWKIVLVDMQGGNVSKKQVSVRFFSAILSWCLAGLGFLWMIVDRNHFSLHDHLSKSRLVMVEKT